MGIPLYWLKSKLAGTYFINDDEHGEVLLYKTILFFNSSTNHLATLKPIPDKLWL